VANIDLFTEYCASHEKIRSDGYAVVLAELLARLVEIHEGRGGSSSHHGPGGHQLPQREYTVLAGEPEGPPGHEWTDHTDDQGRKGLIKAISEIFMHYFSVRIRKVDSTDIKDIKKK
jgi:hypothetical protein